MLGGWIDGVGSVCIGGVDMRLLDRVGEEGGGCREELRSERGAMLVGESWLV